jgi:hypothetical protein
MNSRIVTGVFLLSLLIVGCDKAGNGVFAPVSLAEGAEPPSFLQVGKTYAIYVSATGGRPEKILEIDKKSGWIKVEDQDGAQRWLNLSQIGVIKDAR